MKYPIYPITLSYVSGIFCSQYLNIDLTFCIILSTGLLLLLLLLGFHLYNFKKKPTVYSNYLFTSLLCVTFICLGIFSYKINNPPPVTINLNETDFTVKITEVLKSNKYNHRTYAEIVSIHKKPKVILLLPKSDVIPEIGNLYKIYGKVSVVNGPRNSYDFNYKRYLQYKNIHYQLISFIKLYKVGEDVTLDVQIIKFRDKLVNQFTYLGYDSKTKGFIEALLFGVKTNLDQDLQQQFKNFGILHILAVSGMHVIILFSTFSYILKRFKLPSTLIHILLILFLILFSLMAGLSGSVIRASLMCVMFLVANYTQRRSDSVYILIGSLLIILIISPNYLFDVGFQLSYLSVFSIIYYYPFIKNYFKSKYWIPNYFGEIIGLSIVAQLGVIPFCIYYFNQIPLLFLIGNIIAIPITTILLIGWLLQLIISLISLSLATFFTDLFTVLSDFCFGSLSYLSTKFDLKFLEFRIDVFQCVILSVLIFLIFWNLKNKSFNKLITALGLIIALQVYSIYNYFVNSNKNSTVILYDHKDLLIAHRNGLSVNQISYLDSLSDNIKRYSFFTNTYINKPILINEAVIIDNESWLIVDSLGVYPKMKIDNIILINNPKINLDRLVAYTNPKMIIIHNKNYHYLIDEYSTYFEEKKIPYYDMRSKGSYVINYKSFNNSSADL